VVGTLVLEDSTGDQVRELEHLLRDVADRSPLQAMSTLIRRKDLWLGSLVPRFSGDTLKTLLLLPWRGPRHDLLKWSGLVGAENPGGCARLILDREEGSREANAAAV
jgi:hypothetical protein